MSGLKLSDLIARANDCGVNTRKLEKFVDDKDTVIDAIVKANQGDIVSTILHMEVSAESDLKALAKSRKIDASKLESTTKKKDVIDEIVQKHMLDHTKVMSLLYSELVVLSKDDVIGQHWRNQVNESQLQPMLVALSDPRDLITRAKNCGIDASKLEQATKEKDAVIDAIVDKEAQRGSHTDKITLQAGSPRRLKERAKTCGVDASKLVSIGDEMAAVIDALVDKEMQDGSSKLKATLHSELS
eukprot:COSAG01_NODE_26006_length_726_cov_1.226475_1_plen_242_part_11